MRHLAIFLCLAFSLPTLFAQAAGDTPLAALGLHVPASSIPYALDNFQGTPELVPIHHSTVIVDSHKGANFAGSLAGSFFYKPELTLELEGSHARAQLHSANPVFYLHMETDSDNSGNSPDSDTVTLALVRARIKHNRRVFSKVRFTQITGHAKRSDDVIDSEIEQLPGGWFRLHPKEPLSPGEYALMPIPRVQSTFSTAVFDFGIDSSAPQAKDAIMAKK